jgi:hypothetical protein
MLSDIITFLQHYSNFIGLVVVAYMWGYYEQLVFRFRSPKVGKYIAPKRMLGWASLEYHLPMVMMWQIICFIAGYWWFIGMFAVLQDDAYFRFHPTDTRDKNDWVNAKLGGFAVYGAWIPYTYIIGAGISFVLWFVQQETW